MFIKNTDFIDEIRPISFKEPNSVQKDALEILEVNREEGVKEVWW